MAQQFDLVVIGGGPAGICGTNTAGAMVAGGGASVFSLVCFNSPTLGELYKMATSEAVLRREGVLPT